METAYRSSVRPSYEAPVFAVRGTLAELTAANVAGTRTDVPFGTPAPFILS